MPSLDLLKAVDAEAYLDIAFKRALLANMSPKKRLRVLKDWADALGCPEIVPLARGRVGAACMETARAMLREQLPFLVDP